MSRPRTFAWVAGLRGPTPQIIYEDPRTGCAALPIIESHPIDPEYPHSIALLRRRYPAPLEASDV
ncbi:hypothetical protein [Bradyrhizobium sp. RT9a]|uniref:hypothetical protein n=1 Tax=Bradyrhizobium sp. RT9a TaxID=3156384 RepID=UPI003394FA88